MSDLTAVDRAIRAAPKFMRDYNDGREALRAIYLAGLAAGRARGIEDAAQVCDKLADDAWQPGKHCDADAQWASQSCAAAIRALIAGDPG